jgi:hypothetical protein
MNNAWSQQVSSGAPMAAAYVVPNPDELARMSIAELTQAYVDGTQAAQTTEHVGRLNRLARHQANVKRELGARGEAHRVFRQLADHSDRSSTCLIPTAVSCATSD